MADDLLWEPEVRDLGPKSSKLYRKSIGMHWQWQVGLDWLNCKHLRTEGDHDDESTDLFCHTILEKTNDVVRLRTSFLNLRENERRPFERYRLQTYSVIIEDWRHNSMFLRCHLDQDDPDYQDLKISVGPEMHSKFNIPGTLNLWVTIVPDCPDDVILNESDENSESSLYIPVDKGRPPDYNELLAQGVFSKNLPSAYEIEVVENPDQNHDPLDFAELFANGYFADVKFRIGTRELKAHRCILGAHSPVFREMFSTEMNGVVVMNIKDADYDAMYHFVRYMYTGRLPEADCQEVREVMLLASKYEVNKLRVRCMRWLNDEITLENALEMLEIADACDAQDLVKRAIKVVSDNIKKFDESSLSTLDSHLVAKITMEVVNSKK